MRLDQKETYFKKKVENKVHLKERNEVASIKKKLI